MSFFLISICYLGFNLLRYYNIIGFPSSHVLLPFQRGILFKRGHPDKEVGPGRHRVFIGREKILFLDVRPIQFKAENRAVTLADGATAVYGFNVRAKISDVRKAIQASATLSQMPAFIALCATRASLNGHLSSELAKGRTSLEKEIIAACEPRLAVAGFELVSFQFTQLGIVGQDSIR